MITIISIFAYRYFERIKCQVNVTAMVAYIHRLNWHQKGDQPNKHVFKRQFEKAKDSMIMLKSVWAWSSQFNLSFIRKKTV